MLLIRISTFILKAIHENRKSYPEPLLKVKKTSIYALAFFLNFLSTRLSSFSNINLLRNGVSLQCCRIRLDRRRDCLDIPDCFHAAGWCLEEQSPDKLPTWTAGSSSRRRPSPHQSQQTSSAVNRGTSSVSQAKTI